MEPRPGSRVVLVLESALGIGIGIGIAIVVVSLRGCSVENENDYEYDSWSPSFWTLPIPWKRRFLERLLQIL